VSPHAASASCTALSDLHSTRSVSSPPRSCSAPTTSISRWNHSSQRITHPDRFAQHHQSLALTARSRRLTPPRSRLTAIIRGLSTTDFAEITTTQINASPHSWCSQHHQLSSLTHQHQCPQRYPVHGLATHSSRVLSTTDSAKFDVTHIAPSIRPDRCAESHQLLGVDLTQIGRSIPRRQASRSRAAWPLHHRCRRVRRYPDPSLRARSALDATNFSKLMPPIGALSPQLAVSPHATRRDQCHRTFRSALDQIGQLATTQGSSHHHQHLA